MNRYRIRYKKSGPVKYISHLDLLRTFERGARRAGLPLAFTQGFNPHPRFTFAAPLPVGVEGRDEYMDLILENHLPPGRLAEKLNAKFPAGLEVLDAAEVDLSAPAPMGLVESATYFARAALAPGLDTEGLDTKGLDEKKLDEKINAFMQKQEIKIEKKTKKGMKIKDIRPGIMDLNGEIDGEELILNMTLKTGSRENIRPEEVLRVVLGEVLKEYSSLQAEDFMVVRTRLFTGENKPLNIDIASGKSN